MILTLKKKQVMNIRKKSELFSLRHC